MYYLICFNAFGDNNDDYVGDSNDNDVDDDDDDDDQNWQQLRRYGNSDI